MCYMNHIVLSIPVYCPSTLLVGSDFFKCIFKNWREDFDPPSCICQLFVLCRTLSTDCMDRACLPHKSFTSSWTLSSTFSSTFPCGAWLCVHYGAPSVERAQQGLGYRRQSPVGGPLIRIAWPKVTHWGGMLRRIWEKEYSCCQRGCHKFHLPYLICELADENNPSLILTPSIISPFFTSSVTVLCTSC